MATSAQYDASLARILAYAARRGQGLETAVDALASEYSRSRRRPLLALGDYLRSGRTLGQVAKIAPGLLPSDVGMAAQYGEAIQALPQTMQTVADQIEANQSQADSSATGTLVYFAAQALCLCTVLSFLMVFIVPKFQRIFQGFGTEMPAFSQLVLDLLTEANVQMALLITLVGSGVGLMAWLRTSPSRSRVFGWTGIPASLHLLSLRRATPSVLRLLQVAVAEGVPLERAMEALAEAVTLPVLKPRLLAARQLATQGYSPWIALQKQGLLRGSEVTACEQAESVGNLHWVLGELAENIQRRLRYRSEVMFECLRPIPVLMMGIVVAAVCIAFFLPLVKIMNELSFKVSQSL